MDDLCPVAIHPRAKIFRPRRHRPTVHRSRISSRTRHDAFPRGTPDQAPVEAPVEAHDEAHDDAHDHYPFLPQAKGATPYEQDST